ncbi:hypothetical protein [Deinococcus navajonensis]|uniref:HTH cro/C1-type domain-containing protein n=1 Tax=Deinococcus navajonensis TaxID=309884 RepID=A0ABV8XQ19_9DEIO
MNYLALITPTPDGYAGVIPELTVLANSATPDGVRQALSQGLALHLLDAQAPLPKPRARRLQDLPASVQHAYGDREVEEELITPAPVNPVSLQVERAIALSGLSYREIARRMQITQPALLQMADPFYEDHTVSSLRGLAAVLQLALDMTFVSPVELPEGAVLGHLWAGLSGSRLRVRNVPEVMDAVFPLTIRSEAGTFQLLRPAEGGLQAHSAESTIYDAYELG